MPWRGRNPTVPAQCLEDDHGDHRGSLARPPVERQQHHGVRRQQRDGEHDSAAATSGFFSRAFRMAVKIAMPPAPPTIDTQGRCVPPGQECENPGAACTRPSAVMAQAVAPRSAGTVAEPGRRHGSTRPRRHASASQSVAVSVVSPEMPVRAGSVSIGFRSAISAARPAGVRAPPEHQAPQQGGVEQAHLAAVAPDVERVGGHMPQPDQADGEDDASKCLVGPGAGRRDLQRQLRRVRRWIGRPRPRLRRAVRTRRHGSMTITRPGRHRSRRRRV